MSCHLINMMMRSILLAKNENKELVDAMIQMPSNQRKQNDTVIQFVKNLKFVWSHGTQIERLATLGWNEAEGIDIFCNILDNIDQIRKEYFEELQKHGGVEPPELKDSDISIYEAEVNRKKF